MHIIEFSPPMLNLNGTFNTFRLGLRYSKLLKESDTVLLIDRKNLCVIGHAVIENIMIGSLKDMADLYAHDNHNQRELDEVGASERLMTAMLKRYGPQMVNEAKATTVIYLTLL